MSYNFFFPPKLVVSNNAPSDLAHEVENIPGKNILFIGDEGIFKAGISQPLVDALENISRNVVAYYDIPGNPDVTDVRKALDVATAHKPSLVVALGGGSVIDTAKAVSILSTNTDITWEDLQWGRSKISTPGLPLIAIPTTAGTGSEVTHVSVIGDTTGFKKGVVHPALFPSIALLDGNLTKTLPPHLTAATGMDALVHGIEAYLGKRSNQMTDLFALGAIRDIIRWLPEAVHHGENLVARMYMLQASSWAGIAFDQAGLGLCHALCGPLSNHYHIHHGLGNSILLAPTLAFNAPAIGDEKWIPLKSALGFDMDSTPSELEKWSKGFIQDLGLPSNLSSFGVEHDKIESMAREATQMAMIGNNIRPASVEDCELIFGKAL